MKKINLLIILLILSSCGLGMKKPKHDNRFNPILKQFSKDAAHFGVDVDAMKIQVAFDSVKKRSRVFGFIKVPGSPIDKFTHAFCARWDSSNDVLKPIMKLGTGHYYGTRYIIIDEKLRGASLDYLESVVYHELGHCVLNRGHEPEGIMTAEGVSEFGAFRYFHLEHFFTGRKSSVNALTIENEADEESELVYESSYEAFGQVIDYALFWDPSKGHYYTIQK
jgi:hypothetical protein